MRLVRLAIAGLHLTRIGIMREASHRHSGLPAPTNGKIQECRQEQVNPYFSVAIRHHHLNSILAIAAKFPDVAFLPKSLVHIGVESSGGEPLPYTDKKRGF